MSKETIISIAQKNFAVGDILGNTQKIIDTLAEAQQNNAKICVFPELCLSGYPPEDLLWQPDFKTAIQQAMDDILNASANVADLIIILGFPQYIDDTIFNALAVITNGKTISIYQKQLLPNYGVFDEKRYFTPGEENAVIEANDLRIGFLICEDIWQPEPCARLAQEKLDLILVINASPFSTQKFEERLHLLHHLAKTHHLPMLYVNGVGAQDDLIFDGGSCWVDATGKLNWRADFFLEHLYTLRVAKSAASKVELQEATELPEFPSVEQLMYHALMLGVRDYVRKNHIQGVVLGLSGGIDSALVLAIATDALGADHVTAISLPSRYTASMSIEDAKEQAYILGVSFEKISIESVYEQFLNTLAPSFAGKEKDVTEENIQARCRCVLLMAIANKYHRVLLNTSNKSELAIGYGTLYGDLAGAYMVLKDVPKTWVYRLAHYRNSLSSVIPQRVLERAPSAELAEDQYDQDSLPPYEILDAIIERYVEKNESREAIVAAGYEPQLVLDVIKKIDQNEFKRRQGGPGPKVTNCAFIRERRMPITWG